MDAPLGDGQAPLDDIAYLARSEHRVTALARLADEPMTRRTLHDETGISQPTLGRLLDGFEERGWATCDRTNGRTYELTPVGEAVADAFADLLTTVETMQRFRAVAEHLPLEDIGFDLRRFATADITVPSATDATAHMRREDELIADADSVRFLCSSSFGPGIKAYRDRIVGSDKQFEAVITADALDAALDDPDSAEWIEDLAAAENVSIYRYDGALDLILGVIAEVVSLVPLDDAGRPLAFIETRDEVIRAWAEAELDAYRERADRLEADPVSSIVFTP